eukprot:85737-Pleurochrysis_carterae.AAC.1
MNNANSRTMSFCAQFKVAVDGCFCFTYLFGFKKIVLLRAKSQCIPALEFSLFHKLNQHFKAVLPN